MGKGFFISKAVLGAAIVLAVAAAATIIALAVVYAQEKANTSGVNQPDRPGASTVPPATDSPGTVPPATDSPGTVPPATDSPGTVPPVKPWDRYRLPGDLVPDHYEVTLWPRLDKDPVKSYYFTGNSTVYFRCERKTKLILLHSHKLKVMEPELEVVGAGSPPAPALHKYWLQNETQFLVIMLQEPLSPGTRYSLHTQFEGALADDLSGFYRSQYVNETGHTRVIATTQMQPTDARKAFPCFDEPAMKATFNITLYHKPEHTAISNMPEGKITMIDDGMTWIVTSFQQTPKMSTYLLAFIVSDFIFEHENTSDTEIRIWARKEAIEEGQGKYALNVTGKILDFFENYYNVSYPLPKSDQIALPDFNAGAMENWGLITYRETALLYDPKLSSAGNKERVVKVIAHELAHQWFGNLVTIKWWNDLWLNEGFASYVEYLGANKAEPQWGVKDLIVLNEVYRVFAIDALASSHPLSSEETEINTPAEINELFDAISYSKGASVLRMLSNFLSEQLFVKGLSAYLRQFSYNNTIYADLFEHLQKAVDDSIKLPKTVSEIMSRWTLQMGFPVITINTTTGTVTQKHFLLDPNSNVTRPSKFNYTWIVPITWMKGQTKNNISWLLERQETNPEMKLNGNEWLLANIDVMGYYRVNYDERNWNNLVEQLSTNHTVLPIINRAQIIADSFNLARAKYRETTAALDTTKYLVKEREYIPWQAALDNLAYFELMFDRAGVFGPMKKYMLQQVIPLYKYFENLTQDWEQPGRLMEQYNQINAVRVACGYGLKGCKNMSQMFYKKWMENPDNNPIPVNLKTSIYCSAIASGDEKEWNFAWEMFQNATIATEAAKLRSAMACTKHPWLLNRYLQYTLDSTKIRKQDATSTITSIASNVIGQPLVWDFVRANWKFLFKQYGGGSFSFSSLINGVTQRFSTEFELRQLEQFKMDNQDVGFGSGTRALEQALERTKANIRWVDENKEAVNNWFLNAVDSNVITE